MFSFQGILIFNEQPEDVRNETFFLIFKQKCRKVFYGNWLAYFWNFCSNLIRNCSLDMYGVNSN